MATIKASIPNEIRDWLQTQVENGRIASVSGYVRALIQLDRMKTLSYERQLAKLDAAVAQGLDDAAAGETEDADALFDRLEAKYAAMVAAAAAK